MQQFPNLASLQIRGQKGLPVFQCVEEYCLEDNSRIRFVITYLINNLSQPSLKLSTQELAIVPLNVNFFLIGNDKLN